MYFATLNCRIFCKKFALLTWQKNLQAIRFAHLAKEVTLQGQFCNFRFAQHLQNHLKCSLRSLFTNKFVYACYARVQIRPLPRFFRPAQLCFISAFIAGWMPLYLFSLGQVHMIDKYYVNITIKSQFTNSRELKFDSRFLLWN